MGTYHLEFNSAVCFYSVLKLNTLSEVLEIVEITFESRFRSNDFNQALKSKY